MNFFIPPVCGQLQAVDNEQYWFSTQKDHKSMHFSSHSNCAFTHSEISVENFVKADPSSSGVAKTKGPEKLVEKGPMVA